MHATNVQLDLDNDDIIIEYDLDHCVVGIGQEDLDGRPAGSALTNASAPRYQPWSGVQI
jgi:hypothetical protein